MIYFTSDLHLGHANILKHCNRPFRDVNEMDEAIIRNWNKTVHRNDEVYILGDFSFRGNVHRINEIISRLAGKKYLIKGNHDLFLKDPDFKGGFEWVKDYYKLYHNTGKGKVEFILFHYPIFEWDEMFRGSIHLHGHVHNSYMERYHHKPKFAGQRVMNVGVDVNNFTPIKIDKIISELYNKEIENTR